jgi:hypothetical protein
MQKKEDAEAIAERMMENHIQDEQEKLIKK